MKEELTPHEEEGEIVKCPSEDGESNELIILDDSRVVEILVATLFAQHEQATYANVQEDRDGAQPPRKGISNEVNVSVVLDPKVDATSEEGPVMRSAVVRVSTGQPGIGLPHDFLEF